MFEKENVLKALSETLNKMEKEKNSGDKKETAVSQNFNWDYTWMLLILVMIFGGFGSTPDRSMEAYLRGKVEAYEKIIGEES